MSGMHPNARAGFSASVATYVSGRPDYPCEIDDWLRMAMRLKACKTAVDLGAGTGNFTHWLVEQGCHVIAIEPIAEMRAHLAAQNPEVEVRDGVAEALPLEDASVDAIVCATAFHWFATPNALAQMRRALKVGGRLGLIWNLRDEGVDWVAALSALIAPYEGDALRRARQHWSDVFPAPGFSTLNQRRFAYAHAGPPEQVVIDRLLSTSFVAALDAQTRAEIAAEARLILQRHGVTGPRVAFPYNTFAYDCERLN